MLDFYRALLAFNHMLSDMRYSEEEKEKLLNRYYNYYYSLTSFDDELLQEIGFDYDERTSGKEGVLNTTGSVTRSQERSRLEAIS